MISTPKIPAIKSKGHTARWIYGYDGPVNRRHLKKMARRAQRRDSHKEIEEQLDRSNVEHYLGYAVWQSDLPNMFSPIPVFAMSEDERLGMEHWKQMKSTAHLRGGYLNWRYPTPERVERWCNGAPKYPDETLMEDLRSSIIDWPIRRLRKK